MQNQNSMKTFIAISMATTMIILMSCGRPHYPRQLVEADSLSEVRPDSAKALLNKLRSQYNAFDDDARWYYRLLCLKARGKAYETFDKDDEAEARELLAHYKDGGDRYLLPQAYYYAGCAARDNGNAPMAIDLFQQAMEALPDTTDLKMRSILNFQTGFLLLNQWLYDPAISYFKESLRLEQLRKDTAMAAFCYEKLAFAYRDKGIKDSTMMYFDAASTWASKLNDNTLEKLLSSSEASYYISVKDYKKADSCLTPYMTLADSITIMSTYSMAAKICFYKHDYDSVKYLCQKILTNGNVWQKRSASRLLAKVYSILGNNTLAMKYIDKYEVFSDSAEAIKAIETVARTSASYNYNMYKIENAELKADKAFLTILGLILTFAFIIAISIAIASHRRDEKKLIKSEEIRLKTQQQNAEYIKGNETKIKEINKQLSDALTRNENQAQMLKQQKELLKTKTTIAEHKQEVSKSIKKHIAESEIFNIINKKAIENSILVDCDWNNIEKLILSLIPNFKASIYSIHSISVQEYHLCLLLRIGGLSGKQIATLMARTDSAISKSKKKLHDLFIGNDQDMKLEDFINSL